MQIVIDIPDRIYKIVQNRTLNITDDEILENALKNGTPLPKGHGRLIDADELYGDFIDGTEGYDCQTWYRIEIGDIIEDAPTIIDADKAESEDKE